MRQLQRRITQQLDDSRRGEIIRSGIQLAIIGAPNAGKSSLLNWLGELGLGLDEHWSLVATVGMQVTTATGG